MPAKLITDKKHYRIAEDTTFLCRTRWYESSRDSTFHCTMQIGDGQGENVFIPINEPKTHVTHPKFGIDEIQSETLHVDIDVDDEGCTANMGRENLNAKDHFRTLPTPSSFALMTEELREKYHLSEKSRWLIVSVPLLVHYLLIRSKTTIIILLAFLIPIAIIERDPTGMGGGLMIYFSMIVYYIIMVLLTIINLIQKDKSKFRVSP